MKDLVGAEHHQVLDSLMQRVERIAGGDLDVPRVVVLEGPSGGGKSRIVRELYRRMRATYGADYWPGVDEAGAGSTVSRDPLPGRKRTGPGIDGFVWPENQLPSFGWWQLHCERMQAGEVMDVVGQARPELEAHLVPLALAWGHAASLGEKAGAKRDAMERRARETLAEGGLEVATEVIEQVAGLALPGLGLAANWLFRGVRGSGERRQRKRDVEAAVPTGDRVHDSRRSAALELADLVLGVSHRDLPGVLVVEDVHLMDASLGELLQRLAEPDARRPMLVVAMAWPESREAPAYKTWREPAVAAGRADLLPMPYLNESDLVQIVNACAPSTDPDVALAAAKRFANPLALEATLSAPIVQRAIDGNDGAVPADALDARPVDLDNVYRDRFRELADEVQSALALATGCVPSLSHAVAWPFVRRIVAAAVAACPDVPAGQADVLRGIETAADGEVWLVASGVSDSFREALQARVAHEHLEQHLLLPAARGQLTDAVLALLAAEIDERRDDSVILQKAPGSGLLSSWLLRLADSSPRFGMDHPGALIAAAADVAWELASVYRYEEAVETLASIVQTYGSALTSEGSVRELMTLRSYLAAWIGRSGGVDEAIASSEELLVDRTHVLGADHPDTLGTQHNLASWLGTAGRLSEAIGLFEHVLVRRQQTLGPDDPETLVTLNNLASSLGRSGRLTEALGMFEELLATRLRVLGPAHPDTLVTRNNVAHWLGMTGRVQDAIAMYRLLLQDSAHLGSDHPEVLRMRANLAQWTGEAGLVEERCTALQVVYQDYVRVLGPTAPTTLKIRNNLANAFGAAGRVSAAISELEAVMVDQLEVLGAAHPDTLVTRSHLARWLASVGREDASRAGFDAVLVDQIRVLGPDHPDTLGTRATIALSHREFGTPGSTTDLEGLLGDLERVLGPDHPESLRVRHSVAQELAGTERPHEALAMFERLHEDLVRVLGQDHPDTLANRSLIASTLSGVGQHEAAMSAYERLVADLVRIVGPSHPHTLATRSGYANLLGAVGLTDLAVEECEAIVAQMERVSGPDHPNTLVTRSSLAHWLGMAGRVREAVELYELVLADRGRVLGADHPRTGSTAAALELWRGRL